MYTIYTEPCRQQYRAIVLRGGKIVFTVRGDTDADAWALARRWIAEQAAQPLSRTPQWKPARRTHP